MTVVRRGIRDAFRSLTRTVAIVVILTLSIGLGFVMLIAHKAVQNKIDGTLAAVGTTVTITPAGAVPGSTTSRYLPQSTLNSLARLPHVVAVDETLPGGPAHRGSVGLHSINPDQPVGFVGTTDPTSPANIGASTLTLVAGTTIDGTGRANDALISTALAKRNRLAVGSDFTADHVTFTVTGLFDSDTDTANNTVIVPLATEQRFTHHNHDVGSATVTADSLTNLAAVTGEITFALGPGANVTSDLTAANQALSPLSSVKSLSLYSLLGAVGAAAIITFLITVLTVRERKREIGILRAIGAPTRRVIGQFLSEALTFGVLGTAAGLLTGTLTATAITNSLIGDTPQQPGDPLPSANPALDHLTQVHVTASASELAVGLIGVLLITAAGSSVATYLIAKIHPAEALRSE